MAIPLFEIKDLSINFHMFESILKVLDGVSLLVQKGEKVGLVGETGCGKSITMRATLGLLPMPPGRISTGEILFHGEDILKMKSTKLRDLRGKISLIPQDPAASLNPVFKVGYQLTDAVKYSAKRIEDLRNKKRKTIAIDILKEVGLPDPERNMDSYPVQLSGGMKQRVLIAMALVTQPEFLIADEPSTALDVTIQDQILRLMRQMVEKRGLSILIITHNLGVIRQLTDRTYVMYAGQVVEIARTRDLFSERMHPYTRGLISSVPKLTGEGVTRGIKGMIPDYANPPKGCRFRPRCDFATPICEEKPLASKVGESHEVACFLYQR